MSKKAKWIAAALVGALSLAAVVVGYAIKNRIPLSEQIKIAGVRIFDAPMPVKFDDADLVDQHGQPFKGDRLRKHWSFLFFGYTHCPDVCPNTLGVLQSVVKKQAGRDPKRVPQVVFASVDPQRDTPAKLAEFVSFFSPEFVGITGKNLEAVQKFTAQFGAAFEFEDPESGEAVDAPVEGAKEYQVGHNASVYVFEPGGGVIAEIAPPHDIARVSETLNRLQELL